MRRIALVTPILPVEQDKTRGRFIYETAKALAQLAQVKIYLLQPRYPRILQRPPAIGLLHSEYAHDRLTVEAITYPALPGVTRGLNGYVAARRLVDRVRYFAPEAIIGYWVYPDGYAGLHAARQLGIPALIGALGSDIHMQQGISARLSRDTLQQADAVIAVSEAMRQKIIQDYGATAERVHTIVNGYNTHVFFAQSQANSRQQLNLASNSKIILYVGRLVEAKGLRELVQAFAVLAPKQPQAKLVLVGQGPFQSELSQLINQYALQDQVVQTGGLEPPQVADWIAAADLLTLPSWSEGYPNVVVEALACGRPVVATHVGGIPEIIHADNGLLIPPRQPDVLASALDQALAQPWDHAAIAQAMQRSWHDVAQETLAVCERVIQSGGRKLR